MNLLLWRHAEAENLGEPVASGSKRDMQRKLTKRGEQQAAETARWLRKHLHKKTRVMTSSAVRAVQTAKAYCPDPEILPELHPLADASAILAAIQWPQGQDVLVIGHQPWIGRVASLLLAGEEQDWPVKKSTLWWIAHRIRRQEEQASEQAVLRLVLSPDLLLSRW